MPLGLVVTKGLKSWLATSSGNPDPLSLTAISIPLSPFLVELMVISRLGQGLDAVAQEIDHHLLDLDLVGLHQRQVVFQLPTDAVTLRRHPAQGHDGGFPDELVDLNKRALRCPFCKRPGNPPFLNGSISASVFAR